jgi:penicillin-binding protein 1C
MISVFILPFILFIFFLANLNFFYPVNTFKPSGTLVSDHKGKVVHAFLSSDDKWRLKTTLDEVSPKLKKVLLFKEDRYFYYHPGVNPFALVRAGFMNIVRGKRVSGASTITMQTVRLLEPRSRNYRSKIIEMIRAMQLELQLPKEEIFLLYLNLLPYGGNIEGVKSASVMYLGKNPQQLSLAEIAALSIIPNRPTSLRPGRDQPMILKERNRWLRRLEKAGLFSPEEVRDALSEPFFAERKSAPAEIPHLAHKLRNLYPGENIQSHIQMNLQHKFEKIVQDYIRSIRWHNIHNAAVMVIDNQTRRVITYIGSADFKDAHDGGQVNGAKALRQPGSALKPVLYALGIDAGLFTPQTVVNDVPVNFKGYQPENYDETFRGPVSISYALENSLNIPAVRALNELGTDKLIQTLGQCQFNRIQKDKEKLGLSMVLGGCGVTLEEMAGLYAAQADLGNFKRLRYTTKDIDTQQTRIYSQSAAFMITEMLVKITRPDLPVGYENSVHLPKIAWKTGTSYGRRDAWSIGYNQKYTIAVWVGNFSNVGVPELSGATTATPLLFQLFNTLDYNSQAAWYHMPPGCEIRKVCTRSGHLPDHFCNETRLDYYIPMVSPSSLCAHRRELILSADEQYSYCKNCEPAEGYKKRWFDAIDPELLDWYHQEHISYEKIPPHWPDCDRLFTQNAPVITFPVHGAEYLIPLSKPEPLQLSCRSADDVKYVYWYINNRFYQKSPAREKIWFQPEEGDLLISCSDDKGRNSDIKIKVKKVDL